MAAAWHKRDGKRPEARILPAVVLLYGSEAMATACCPSSLLLAFAKQGAEVGAPTPPGKACLLQEVFLSGLAYFSQP